jgi:chemotaxis protein methyltransferase WspC
MSANAPGVVERLLAERIGLDPSSVGDGLIARGVQTRMAALGLRSKAEYERALIERIDEVQALVEEVVVPESWFFRDEKPFEVLTRLAQEWVVDRSRPPLSALSLPCASGEEPYSIAITLREAGLSSDQFRVDAVDVSARSLAKAIAGVYGPNAFRGEATSRRSSYFREQNGSFTLDLALRSTVRFHIGNLLDAGLFADRGPFDVVFCRNLLIYLDDDANALASATLTRLVADGGLLFLGHADRLEAMEGSPFEPLADKGSFAYRKGPKPAKVGLVALKTTGAAKTPHPGPPPRGGRESEKMTPHPGPPPQGGREADPKPGRLPPSGPLPPCGGGLGWGASHDQERSKSAFSVAVPEAKPGPPAQEARKLEKGADATVLDRASSLADSGQYEAAKALVEEAIAGGQSNARAYFLLGMIAQAAGARDPAEAHYLKAIYLDPQHDEALLALALLARRKGDVAAEAAYRRRADRVRARKVVS